MKLYTIVMDGVNESGCEFCKQKAELRAQENDQRRRKLEAMRATVGTDVTSSQAPPQKPFSLIQDAASCQTLPSPAQRTSFCAVQTGSFDIISPKRCGSSSYIDVLARQLDAGTSIQQRSNEAEDVSRLQNISGLAAISVKRGEDTLNRNRLPNIDIDKARSKEIPQVVIDVDDLPAGRRPDDICSTAGAMVCIVEPDIVQSTKSSSLNRKVPPPRPVAPPRKKKNPAPPPPCDIDTSAVG